MRVGEGGELWLRGLWGKKKKPGRGSRQSDRYILTATFWTESLEENHVGQIDK